MEYIFTYTKQRYMTLAITKQDSSLNVIYVFIHQDKKIIHINITLPFN